MRNLDGAAADEFADHRVAGDEIMRRHLFLREAGHGFQQGFDAVVSDARVQKTGVGRKVLRQRQQPRPRKNGLSAGRSKGNPPLTTWSHNPASGMMLKSSP